MAFSVDYSVPSPRKRRSAASSSRSRIGRTDDDPDWSPPIENDEPVVSKRARSVKKGSQVCAVCRKRKIAVRCSTSSPLKAVLTSRFSLSSPGPRLQCSMNHPCNACVRGNHECVYNSLPPKTRHAAAVEKYAFFLFPPHRQIDPYFLFAGKKPKSTRSALNSLPSSARSRTSLLVSPWHRTNFSSSTKRLLNLRTMNSPPVVLLRLSRAQIQLTADRTNRRCRRKRPPKHLFPRNAELARRRRLPILLCVQHAATTYLPPPLLLPQTTPLLPAANLLRCPSST
jgi:hypothetical protein